MELVDHARATSGARIDAAVELTTRLPRTLAGDGGRQHRPDPGHDDRRRAPAALTDADAAYADEVLAAAAPGRRRCRTGQTRPPGWK